MTHQPSLLPSAWDVPDIFRRRLGNDVGRQRSMFHDGHLLLVLHDPPSPEETLRTGRFFWRKPDGTWVSTMPGSGPTAVERHLDEFQSLLSKLDEQEAAALTSKQYFDVLHQLTPLVRATHNLHAALQESRQQVPDDRRIIDYRDRAYTLERQAELMLSDAKNALDFRIARQAEAQAATNKQMAAAAHRLNVLAAFFFPIATLTAIFGVNLHLPLSEVKAYWPIAALLGGGLFIGLVLTLFVTRRL